MKQEDKILAAIKKYDDHVQARTDAQLEVANQCKKIEQQQEEIVRVIAAAGLDQREIIVGNRRFRADKAAGVLEIVPFKGAVLSY